LERFVADSGTQRNRLCYLRIERDLRCRCRGNRSLPFGPDVALRDLSWSRAAALAECKANLALDPNPRRQFELLGLAVASEYFRAVGLSSPFDRILVWVARKTGQPLEPTKSIAC